MPEACRKVLSGIKIQLTSYGKPIGVALVPLEEIPEAVRGKRLAADG